jgi:hypothetical protein
MISATFQVSETQVEVFRYALKNRLGAKETGCVPTEKGGGYRVTAEFTSATQARRGDDLLWGLENATK